MNIILVSNHLGKAKSLSFVQALMVIAALICLPVLFTLLMILPHDTIKQQGVKVFIPSHFQAALQNPQSHLDAYAQEIGKLQARILRLDAQSARLAKLAGEQESVIKNNPKLKPIQNLQPNAKSPGTGGPYVNTAPITEQRLKNAVEELNGLIDGRDDYISDIEAKLLQQSVLKDTLPNSSPVNAAYNSSSYGWRVDPINGTQAFHEGLDFSAATGTPIYAAADGIVTTAEVVSGYGKMVKIDHGQGVETRYGHTSELLVKAGQRVEKGQIIAKVGSTGRSTGPHLHYEIRLDGEALDPRKYLPPNAP